MNKIKLSSPLKHITENPWRKGKDFQMLNAIRFPNSDFSSKSFQLTEPFFGKRTKLNSLNLRDFKAKARSSETSKQQLSITYEEIGLFPRSFNRVFDRFFKQIFLDVENLVIQEYRFYRYLFLTTLKSLFILILVPFSIHFFSKNYLVRPITEYYWNSNQSEIFLNSHQQKQAFQELQNFEEKIYFESLISDLGSLGTSNLSADKSFLNLETKENSSGITKEKTEIQFLNSNLKNPQLKSTQDGSQFLISPKQDSNSETKQLEQNVNKEASFFDVFEISVAKQKNSVSKVRQSLQQKTNELALRYNNQSIESITNFFADLLSFATLVFLFFRLSIQINITKSFLLEVFFGLDDSKKSLLILFITDLSVGYHSPNIWELFFQFFFFHYGIPENETTIFLLVATLPVLLDVLFKYLIFRHLNRASPATVATYHAMIE